MIDQTMVNNRVPSFYHSQITYKLHTFYLLLTSRIPVNVCLWTLHWADKCPVTYPLPKSFYHPQITYKLHAFYLLLISRVPVNVCLWTLH
jgi:hypothetical protein